MKQLMKQIKDNDGMLYDIQKDMDNTLGSGMKKITDDFYVDKTKELGKGNFGVVYKGYHLSTNRLIAVKFVEKKTLIKFPDYEREIMVMHDLSKINHPHIMGYYGYEENEEGLYCFIEFCNGGNLKDLIQNKISQMKVLSLFRQMLDAMTYINEQNKVHRDLKPDNILLDEHGELKIADFGLAREMEAKMTKGVCTPLYAAPEVINLQPYDEKCDVWSGGLILYEMLTGKQMFADIKKKTDLLRELASFAKDSNKVKIPKQFHPEWQNLIRRMLTHNKGKRATFKEMKDIFSKVEQSLRSDLIDKYGYEAQGVEQFENELRLTKSISPYQSNPKNEKKNNLADMAAKLKEERSFQYMNNMRKWVHFARQKAEVMVKLIKEFNSSQYGCIKNVQKYILMFLSVSCYISRMANYLNQMKSKKIHTPDGIITESEISKIHEAEFAQLILESTTKHESSITKYKGVLEKQIIPKILDTYMKREEEKKIVTDIPELLNLLTEAKEGKYRMENIYETMFSKIVNSHGLHFSNNILKDFKYEDLKVYTYIRLICCIDEAFLNSNYRNDDYLRVYKQKIQNSSKEDLLELISKFNKA